MGFAEPVKPAFSKSVPGDFYMFSRWPGGDVQRIDENAVSVNTEKS